MKKFYLLLILGLFSVGVFAQKTGAYVTAGANYSNYVGSDVLNSDGRIGYQAGFLVGEEFAERMIFMIGIYYSQAGDKDTRINQTSWPMTIGYRITDKIFFHAGPQLNLFVEGRDSNGDKVEDATEIIDQVNVDLLGKVSYELNDKIFAFGQYSYGLTDPFKDSSSKVRKQVISIGVAYSFIR